MPHFRPSDIPEMSDAELEEFLNITIAQLITEPRIQHQLYTHNICIVADLLKENQGTLANFGSRTYRLIGDSLWNAIRALIGRRNESLQS